MRTNIPFIQDGEATEEVQGLFKRIKAARGFVAPSWRALAHKPEYLKLIIDKFDLVFGEGRLDQRSKLLVYLAISILNKSSPCIYVFFRRLREMGITDKEFIELLSIIDAASGMNVVVNACGFQAEDVEEIMKQAGQ